MPGTSLVVAILLFAPHLRAADSPAPEKGYHDVTVQSGGKPTVIRVKDSVGPRLQGEPSSDGTYDPENMDLGRTSSFSNKAFSTRNSALSKNDTAAEARSDHPFLTKAYFGGKPDLNFNQKYPTASFSHTSTKDSDFQKSFATSPSTVTAGKDTSFATKPSSFQDRTATLGGPKSPPFAGFSILNDKSFSDPELKHVRRDPYAGANNLDVSRMVDLPNRPLTIDEVRNLINHETIPNLDEKPDAPSKPLNNPGYEPPTVAPPAHDDIVPPGPQEKETELPSPGMMSTPPAPENSEPLPK